MMGIQAVREPAGLHSSDGRCPDLQLVLPGRHIISDVVVTHPLAPSWVKKQAVMDRPLELRGWAQGKKHKQVHGDSSSAPRRAIALLVWRRMEGWRLTPSSCCPTMGQYGG